MSVENREVFGLCEAILPFPIAAILISDLVEYSCPVGN
jgi:hypothetical protein